MKFKNNIKVMMDKDNTIDKISLTVSEDCKDAVKEFLNSDFIIADEEKCIKFNIYKLIKSFYKVELTYSNAGVYHHEFEARFTSDLPDDEVLMNRLRIVEFIKGKLDLFNARDKAIVNIDYMMARMDYYATTSVDVFGSYLVTYITRGYNAFVLCEEEPQDSDSTCSNVPKTNEKLIKASILALEAYNNTLLEKMLT